jgi:hypothetical protein
VIVARFVSAAIGVSLMAAPTSTDANPGQSTSMHVSGPIIVALSLAAAAPALESLRLLLVPAGGWLIVAPLVLGADWGTAATSVIAGALIIVLAWPAHRSAGRRDGGWSALAPLVRPARRTGDVHHG